MPDLVAPDDPESGRRLQVLLDDDRHRRIARQGRADAPRDARFYAGLRDRAFRGVHALRHVDPRTPALDELLAG